MGGAVSSGRNNDGLIDNLLEADYIKSSTIERVFRAVDRAEYFLPEARNNAYKDLAWKNGNIHLSAPCIYSEVLEGLCLKSNLSFLNLGSGTGYLSTMVGLVLGTNGFNHGVEIHEDVVQYANKKLDEFKKFSGAIDEFDFCEPKFIQGNCLCLTSDCFAMYDRVYCGAACPEQFQTYMKNLLKIDGILVMPLNDQLLQIRRLSETDWSIKQLLPVSFATLIMPPEDHQQWVAPIEMKPLPLQLMCRTVIRNILRKNIEIEHPPVKKSPSANKVPKKKRVLRRLVVPLFDSDDSSEEEHHVRLGRARDRDAPRATFRRDNDNILSFFLQGTRNRIPAPENEENNRNRRPVREDQAMETDATDPTTEENRRSSNSHQVRAVIEHHPEETRNETVPAAQNQNDNEDENTLETIEELNDVIVECLNILRRERGSLQDEDEIEEAAAEEPEEIETVEEGQNIEEAGPSNNGKGRSKREKFDSGIGDEIIETQDSSEENDMKLEVISSCDEDLMSPARNKRGIETRPKTRKFRKLYDPPYRYVFSDTSSSDGEEEPKQTDNEMRFYESPFTEHMKTKIQQLPLPPILKRYLNFYREF